MSLLKCVSRTSRLLIGSEMAVVVVEGRRCADETTTPRPDAPDQAPGALSTTRRDSPPSLPVRPSCTESDAGARVLRREHRSRKGKEKGAVV